MNLLNNRYHLHKVIGQGGMGKVYLAIDTHTSENVAIKECIASTSRDVKRIKREFSLMQKINSVYVVKSLDYFCLNDKHFIVMQYISGITLDQLIASKPSQVDLDQQLFIITEICKAVTVLNKHSIMHRDLKPENIMLVGEKYHPVILDLGIAKAINKELTALTKTNEVIGTAGYISPEQINGKATTNSDVFSLGVVFYQFLNWQTQSPFFSPNVMETLLRIHNQKLPLLSKTISTKKPYLHKLAKIIQLSTQKDNSIRTSSVDMMFRQLKNIHNNRFTMPGKHWKQIYNLKWYLLFCFVITITTLFIKQQYNSRQRVIAYANKISYLYGIQDYKKALSVCNQVIAEGLDEKDLYFRRGTIYIELKKYQEAILDFQKAIKHGLHTQAVYSNIGFSYHKLQQFKQAIYYLNRAIKIEPSAQALNSLGNCYFSLKKYDLAFKNFKHSLVLNPKMADAHENMANVYQTKKKYQKAVESFSKAIEIKPYSSTAFNNRGFSYFHLKKYDKALADFKKSASLAPDSPYPYIGLAKYYFFFKEYATALLFCEKAIQLEQNPDFYLARGEVHYFNNNYTNAIKDFSIVIEMAPSMIEPYLKRADIYFYFGKFNDSLRDIKKVKELKPDSADAFFVEGNVYFAMNRFGDSIVQWTKAIKFNSHYAEILKAKIRQAQLMVKKSK